LFIYLFLLVSLVCFEGYSAKGVDETTPFIQRGLSHDGRLRNGELTVKLSDLDESLLSQINTLEVTNIKLKKIKGNEAEALPVNKIKFLGNHFPNLQKLNINNFVVMVVAARELGNIGRLLTLEVPNCKLGKEGALSLRSMPNLSELNIRNNNIGDDGAVVFKSLPNLRVLEAGWNSLTESGLVNLTLLNKLEKLTLCYNKVGSPRSSSGVISRSITSSSEGMSVSQVEIRLPHTASRLSVLHYISQLKNITFLDICGGAPGGKRDLIKNFIEPEDLREISLLENLTVLKLGGGDRPSYFGNIKDISLHPLPLSSRGPSFLESLKLKELVALDSGIEDEGLKSIGKILTLEKLDLSANTSPNTSNDSSFFKRRNDSAEYPDRRMSGTGLSHLLSLQNLTDLSLNNHALGDYASVIGNLTSLVHLSLRDTLLTENSIVSFGNLVNLSSLNLSYNHIGKGTRHLVPLVQIKTLDLFNSNIHDEAFSYLLELKELENLRFSHLAAFSLTPRSIPNLNSFFRDSKVKKFYIGDIYYSEKEKRKAVREWEVMRRLYLLDRNQRMLEHAESQLRWKKQIPVWTNKDLQSLLSGLPPGFESNIKSLIKKDACCLCQ